MGPLKAPVKSLTWAGNRRLLYTFADENPELEGIWEAKLDSDGVAHDAPVRVAHAEDYSYIALSATADGSKAAIVRLMYQTDVYTAPLNGEGNLAGSPRRLTIDDRNDLPGDWTRDHRSVIFSSDRNGTQDIFAQDLDSETARLIAGGPDRQMFPRLTPDGRSVLFVSGPENAFGPPFMNSKLMRVSVDGGSPVPVMDTPHYASHQCTSGGCIVELHDRHERIVYEVDPEKGRGKELFRHPRSDTDTALSPDGKRLAWVHDLNVIRVAGRDGSTKADIAVKGARFVTSLKWTSNGLGFYAGGTFVSTGAALLHVDMKGNTRVLWEQNGSHQTLGIPSSDGKQLAILGATTDSNVWLMENF